MMAARNDDGEVVEISQPTNDGDGDLVIRLRQEHRNYSDTFQMYDFLYTMTMSCSDGGDVILFVSRLVNIHGDTLQRVFEIIFTTCLRNINLQHFGRNNLVETDFVQFNVEHTDFIDYVYSSRNVRYNNFDAIQLTDGLMQWLSNLAQSERKINIRNRWIVRLMVSRMDEGSVPRGSGLTDNVVAEQTRVTNGTNQEKTADIVLDEVIRIGVGSSVPTIEEDDEEESDDEFDDDEGRPLFNSDAINHMVESNVLNKLNDYSVNSGSLSGECLLVALYVGYLRLTQPNNFNRIMSKGKGWMSDRVARCLEGIAKVLGKAKDRGHWEEIVRMQGLLVDAFNLTPFYAMSPSHNFLCAYRQNCEKELRTYPVYVLMHELGRSKRSHFRKLYGVNDNGIFPNLSPLVLMLKNGHYYNVWDYQELFIDCDNRGIRKNMKGSPLRYKKRFCLRCMVSFSNEELHICEGRCRKCLQHYSDHDGTTVIKDGREAAWWCGECGCDFCNNFCFAAHSRVGLREGGRFANFCELLSTLDQCQRCMEEFELVHRCRHKKNRKGAIPHHDGEGQRRNKLVRCGYCSESYERGSSNHKCFLSKRDFVFGNARKRSKTINVHNVFYFDIESRLEVKYECKFQCMDKKGEMVTLCRSVIVNNAKKVDWLRGELREEESACMVVNKCKSHVPTLVCVVNAIGTLKKHFCEKELRYGDPIRHFLLWCAEDVVKKTNSFRGERNDYVFVAHNASGYDTQFIYQAAYNMFGSNNVSVLRHMNRMIELMIQIATGSRLSTMVFKDSYKFINLPLRAMPKSFGFHNELQKGFFHIISIQRTTWIMSA